MLFKNLYYYIAGKAVRGDGAKLSRTHKHAGSGGMLPTHGKMASLETYNSMFKR